MIDALVQYAAWFTPEQYLWWTRLQCIGWTAADAVIVAALIRLANAARSLEGKRQHLFSYIVLAISLLYAPLVLVAPTGGMVFAVELFVTVPHFLLILYLLGANHAVFSRLVARLHARDCTARD